MKLQIKYKDKFNSYIIVFILIYMTSSYYTTGVKTIPGIVIVMSLFFATIVSVLLSRKNIAENFNPKGFLLLLFMFIVALLSCLICGDNIYHYAILLFSVVTGYLITLSYSFNKFANALLEVMYFLSVFSLVVFLAVWIYPSVIDYAPIIGQRAGLNVHNLLFAVALPEAEFNRNYGLFWEPGAFQTYLNLALTFELFINKKIRMKYVFVFIAAIVTTFSTTGYFALALILIAYILNSKKLLLKIKHMFKYFVAFLIVGLMVFNFWPNDYTYLLFGKLAGIFSEGGSSDFSTSVRINAIIYPFYEFIKSPLIGIGYEKYLSMASEKLYTMPTCTPINWFALFGVLWGIPCSYYYLRNTLRFHCGLISKFLLGIALLLIIMSEDYTRIAFIYVLIFYGVGKFKRIEKHKIAESS